MLLSRGGQEPLVIDTARVYIGSQRVVVTCDISDPNAPRKIGRCDVPISNKISSAVPMAARGCYLYVTGFVSDPPRLDVTVTSLPGSATGLACNLYASVLLS